MNERLPKAPDDSGWIQAKQSLDQAYFNKHGFMPADFGSPDKMLQRWQSLMETRIDAVDPDIIREVIEGLSPASQGNLQRYLEGRSHGGLQKDTWLELSTALDQRLLEAIDQRGTE